MGGKRNGKRKHLFLSVASVACLILAVAAGCTTVVPRAAECPECPKLPKCPECPEYLACPQYGHLLRVESLLRKGNFDGAMKESHNLLADSPKTPPGDEALMDLGLISAHYANPRKDYQKALGYFRRLEREFPRSPLAEEAKIWVSVLRAFEKAKQVDLEIEEMKKELVK